MDLPADVDGPADTPSWRLIEIGHPLLAKNINTMSKPNGEYRLVVWRRSPIEIVDRVRITSVGAQYGDGGDNIRNLREQVAIF